MKKLIFICLSALLSVATWAYDFEIDGVYYSIIESSYNNNVGVVGLYYLDEANSAAYSGDVVIPSSVLYNGWEFTVTSIQACAMYACSEVTSVTIPNTVTSIGGYAFQYCSGITEMVLPNNLTHIGNYTFSGCSSLKEIVIPNSVGTIQAGALQNCSSLESVTLSTSLTSIASYMFDGCTGLKNITIPGNITSIDGYAFRNCTFSEITLPETITSFGAAVFYDCASLKEVIIPSSITELGSGFCQGCTSLEKVVLPDGLTKLGSTAFRDCVSLQEITLPETLTTIERLAFDGCAGLAEVYSLNPEPPTCNKTLSDDKTFGGIKEDCVLYVPEGSLEAYSTAEQWKDFSKIVELEGSGIDNVSHSKSAAIVNYYTTDAKELDSLQKGVNIVRFSDGTTKKVFVK